VHTTDALYKDTSDAQQTVAQIEAGSLLLRNLGYFSIEVLEEIEKAKAYHSTRLKSKVKLYTLNAGRYDEMYLTTIHRKMKRNGLLYQELDVYIVATKKMPVRLLIEKMPQQEVDKRLGKTSKEARKKSRKVSEQ
jgi:hypothetical protein